MFTGPVGIILILLGLTSLVCFILVVVRMFQEGQTGLGIVTILTLFCGIGGLIAFVYGWIKSKDWNLQTVMLVWTVVVVASIALQVYLTMNPPVVIVNQ